MQSTFWCILSPYRNVPIVSGPFVGARAFILTSTLRLEGKPLDDKKVPQELLGWKYIAVSLCQLIFLSPLLLDSGPFTK